MVKEISDPERPCTLSHRESGRCEPGRVPASIADSSAHSFALTASDTKGAVDIKVYVSCCSHQDCSKLRNAFFDLLLIACFV